MVKVTGYKTFSKFPETSKHCSCPTLRIVREVGYHLPANLSVSLCLKYDIYNDIYKFIYNR